eukprot:6112301-Prymnesium_polylepis.1
MSTRLRGLGRATMAEARCVILNTVLFFKGPLTSIGPLVDAHALALRHEQGHRDVGASLVACVDGLVASLVRVEVVVLQNFPGRHVALGLEAFGGLLEATDRAEERMHALFGGHGIQSVCKALSSADGALLGRFGGVSRKNLLGVALDANAAEDHN